MSPALTRVVSWGHELLAEKVKKNQLTVDLTAGNGYDTLMLYRLVGAGGQVIAFDIQASALESTRQRLLDAGAEIRLHTTKNSLVQRQPGVDLIEAGHETLLHYLPEAPHGVIANLGYLPGGDQQLVTRPDSTLQALESACQVLAPGGRLAVVVYPGHPGGSEEGEQVCQFFAKLNQDSFQVLEMKVANRPQAPFLLVAEKRAARWNTAESVVA